MTVIDAAYEGVGQKAGIVIWRIEEFEVKLVPTREHGNFYVGDSYIVLNTKELKNQRLEWDIHFWLGDETTQDEAGTAAIKSVELDDVLGGGPVQHREVQGHESPLFLSYFKRGIRYLEGGIKSGFHHVEEETPVKRLLRVKGRRHVRLHQMPAQVSSLNGGDCFVLDSGPSVWVFVGSGSGRMERIKAIQAANAIRDDVHCGRSTVKIVDGSSSSSEVQEFFDEIGGGSMADISEAGGDDDASFEATFETQIALYKVWEDDAGDLQVEMVSEKPLKQAFLQSDVSRDCFLLDGGLNGLFVWIGKGSSSKERAGAMKLADKFIEKKSYPKWLPVKRVLDGGEPPLFKTYFTDWSDRHEKPIGTRLFKLSNQSGRLKAEEICNFTQEDLSPDDVMVLDAGNEVFIWIGQGADEEEKSGSRKILEDYIDSDPSERSGGSVDIVVLEQGSEPDSFRTHFGSWNASLWDDLSNMLLSG